MNKIIATAACALLLTTTFVAAQSSMGKGGAAVTGESADPAKTPGVTKQSDRNISVQNDGGAGTTGIAPGAAGMGGANKNGDGQMTKGGANK